MENRNKAKQLSIMGMFLAIIIILAFTPIGYIQLPFIKATIIHVPVIIGAIILGPKYGSVLGFIFGMTSLISNTMTPTISSFVFSPLIPMPGTGEGSFFALMVCFIPRILVGVVPWFVYQGLRKLWRNKFDAFCLAVCGVVGSLTNTLLVMHLIYFFFKDTYSVAKDIPPDTVYNVILGIITVNGIPEAIVAGVFTAAISIPLKVFIKRAG